MGQFDPKAYLASKAQFDPKAYLATKVAPTDSTDTSTVDPNAVVDPMAAHAQTYPFQPPQERSQTQKAFDALLQPFNQSLSTYRDAQRAANNKDIPLSDAKTIQAMIQAGTAATLIPSLINEMKLSRVPGMSSVGSGMEAVGNAIPEGANQTIQLAGKGLSAVGVPNNVLNLGMSPEAANTTRENVSNILPFLVGNKVGGDVEGKPLYDPTVAPPSKAATMLRLGLRDKIDASVIDRTLPELQREHNLKPITTVADMTAAANNAIGRISDKVSPIINEKFKNNYLPMDDVIGAAKDALAKEEWTPQDQAKAIKSLQDLGIDEGETQTLSKADKLRKKLGEETSPFFNMTAKERATSNITKAEMVAKRAAADALRTNIYGTLEDYGVNGIDDLRRKQGDLIQVRNAAEDAIDAADKTYPVSKLKGLIHSPVVAGSIAYGLGRAAGLPFGTDVLAGVSAKVSADALKSRYTPNALVERAFGKIGSEDVGKQTSVSGVPENLSTPQGRQIVLHPLAEYLRRVAEGKRVLESVPDATKRSTFPSPLRVAPFEMPAPREMNQ